MCLYQVTSLKREMCESLRENPGFGSVWMFHFTHRRNPAYISEEVVHIDLFVMFPYFHVKIISSLLSSFLSHLNGECQLIFNHVYDGCFAVIIITVFPKKMIRMIKQVQG